MFDFFKDIYYELNGIDSNSIQEERRKKREEKRKERFIFSKSAKVIVFIFGILYLIVGIINMTIMKENAAWNVVQIIRLMLLSICDIACLVCLSIGKKKTEIIALILIFVFIVVQYFTIILL